MKPRSSQVDKGQSNKASHSASQQSALWSPLLRAMSVGAGTLVCVMVLLGASGQNENGEGANRKKIESMTPSERAQLKRNYEKYQKLSAQDKQRFHEIHAATRKQPELNQVMRAYCDWVKTLSPWEQEDLRNAKNSQERMELIRKFRSQENQGNRRGSRSDYEILRILEINFRDPRMMFLRFKSPPSDLYKEVIGIIERSLPRSVEYPRPKDALSEFERSLAVLKTMSELKNRKLQEGKNGSDWPPLEVMKSIYELLGEKKFTFRDSGEQRNTRPFPRDESRQKAMLSLFLARGLMDQLVESVKQELDQQTPPDEELQKFFETGLDTKHKDYLMKYPPDEMQEKLKYLYLQKNFPADVRKKIKGQSEEVKALVPQLFRGIDLKGPAFEGPFKRGNKERMQEMKGRRSNDPQGRGDRPFRDRKPGQGPLGKPRKRPDA